MHERLIGQHCFTALNERVAFLSLNLGGLRVKLFGVYFPDSSYCDLEVESVYSQLDSQLLDCACDIRTHCIVAGDFNARVGSQDTYDDVSILGSGGLPGRNSRGDWLLQWCAINQLVIANTHFETDAEKIWTYRNADTRKQLDYFLFDKRLFKRVQHCAVQPDLDTGSDHRAVEASLSYSMKKKPYRKKENAGKCISWSLRLISAIWTVVSQLVTSVMGLLKPKGSRVPKRYWKPENLRE